MRRNPILTNEIMMYENDQDLTLASVAPSYRTPEALLPDSAATRNLRKRGGSSKPNDAAVKTAISTDALVNFILGIVVIMWISMLVL